MHTGRRGLLPLGRRLDLWMAAIRLELNRRVWEVSPPVPEDAEELAQEMERVAERREVAFTQLLEELAPSLIDRAREAVPGKAILGWVLPAAEYPGVPGNPQMRFEITRSSTATRPGTPTLSQSGVKMRFPI